MDHYAKAIVGAVMAGLTAYATALTGDGPVTGQEWIGVALAVVASLTVIWGVPNEKARPR